MRVRASVAATVVFACSILTISAQGQTTWYVDDDARVGGNGFGWETAYRYLQDTLAVAVSGDDIRVAAGTYKPDRDEANLVTRGNRFATFHLSNGVSLYGGYRGCPDGDCSSGDPDERDIELYESIFSGDLAGDDGPEFSNNDENSYNVVYGSHTDSTAYLDGFTITGGNADGYYSAGAPRLQDGVLRRGRDLEARDSGRLGGLSDDGTDGERISPNRRRYGGGMFNNSGSPTLANCTFIGNAARGGGGLFNSGSSPILTGCTFSNNAAGRGGGVRNESDSAPVFTDCTFVDNAAKWGGAMWNANSDTTLTACRLNGNSATEGGARYWRSSVG